MSFPDGERRRPPPSTGRQDRHRTAPAQPAATPDPDPAGSPGPEPIASPPPRGAAHYAKGRANNVGLSCLVVLFLAGAAAGLLLLVIGLTSSDELVPAAGISPDAAITENPPGGEAPAEAE